MIQNTYSVVIKAIVAGVFVLDAALLSLCVCAFDLRTCECLSTSPICSVDFSAAFCASATLC